MSSLMRPEEVGRGQIGLSGNINGIQVLPSALQSQSRRLTHRSTMSCGQLSVHAPGGGSKNGLWQVANEHTDKII